MAIPDSPAAAEPATQGTILHSSEIGKAPDRERAAAWPTRSLVMLNEVKHLARERELGIAARETSHSMPTDPTRDPTSPVCCV